MDPKELLKLADDFAKEAKKKRKIPKGFADKVMKGKTHPHKSCVTKMKKHMDDPNAFCAKMKDIHKGTTKWRSEERKKK